MRGRRRTRLRSGILFRRQADRPSAPVGGRTLSNVIQRFTWKEMTDSERERLYSRGAAGDLAVELHASIGGLVDDVKNRGDAAVVDALARFDGIEIEASGLRVSSAEVSAAVDSVGRELRAAISQMIRNIRLFNEALLERRGSWQTEIAPGHIVGEKVGPVASAALFCPSGKASYPSVLAQIATPAVVAGVEQLSVIVPPVPGGSGEVDEAVLVVAHELGLDTIFRVNGPAGIAAAAFGTETISSHGMVIGPGSPAVALAQLAVRAEGVDTVVMGPTESLVIADSTADITLLAADLLNEAEHGTDSTVVLVTDDADVIEQVDREAIRQAAELPMARRTAVQASLGENGGAVLVDSLDQACEVANWFAAEHCQLAVQDPVTVAQGIEHAGELLLGQLTPFSVGNFTLGGPAALPTGGYANRAGGITVENYLKAAAIGHLDDTAFNNVAASTIALSEHEGFPAHANAIRVRGERH